MNDSEAQDYVSRVIKWKLNRIELELQVIDKLRDFAESGGGKPEDLITYAEALLK